MRVGPEETAGVRTIVGSGVEYEAVPWHNVGERVTIASGPLFGVSRILLAERGRARVVV